MGAVMWAATTGGFILYMVWGITSEQFMSKGTTRALHESRADKAFAVVVW